MTENTNSQSHDTEKKPGKQPESAWIDRVPVLGPYLKKRRDSRPLVPVIRMSGVIADGGGFGRQGISLEKVSEDLDKAFTIKGAKAVAIVINSPGGSPAQSILIADRIRALSDEHAVPVLAFCEDAAASGGYWLACAGDEIYATGASVIGSIGVISAGFGFTDLLSKIGVERRVYAAGENKSQLDPFLPPDQEDITRLKELQQDIHDQFKTWVQERRGAQLKSDEEPLFGGRFWTGRAALALGLIDGLGDVRTICREKFGDKVRLPMLTQPKGWFQRRVGLSTIGSWFGRTAGAAGVANEAVDALSAKADEAVLWRRLGL